MKDREMHCLRLGMVIAEYITTEGHHGQGICMYGRRPKYRVAQLTKSKTAYKQGRCVGLQFISTTNKTTDEKQKQRHDTISHFITPHTFLRFFLKHAPKKHSLFNPCSLCFLFPDPDLTLVLQQFSTGRAFSIVTDDSIASQDREYN
jgi:hypothetical protein